MPKIILAQRDLFKKSSNMAFRGDLVCPYPIPGGTCGNTKWKFVERVTPHRIRYRCTKCHRTLQYDISLNEDFLTKHPYEPFKRRIFQDVVDRWKNRKQVTIR